MSKILIGTSGWSYPKGEGTWNGYFYPPGEKDEIGFYSHLFKTVEINSTFYAPLNPAYAARWVGYTPPDFIFTAKLWQKFTHPRMFNLTTGEVASMTHGDVEVFLRGIEPIRVSGKLGAVLAQFPPSFENNPDGCHVLNAILNTFRHLPLAVELRHRSWSDDPATEELLREYNTAWVQTDEPRFPISSVEKLPITADFAYFRFHGRNKQDWWTGNNETRYRYLYSKDELQELASRVCQTALQTKIVYAYFNNHWQGYAPKNAADLEHDLPHYSD